MTDAFRTHGVLVTFRRRDALAEHLDILARQTAPLTSLLVVDNDDDEEVRALVEAASRVAADVHYLGLADNPGPAGAIAAGIADVADRADPGDWLVLLDDDDPPPRDSTLATLATIVRELATTDETLGGVGLWGATLEPTGRLRAATGTQPERVAYLPGGACPHYRVGALQQARGPDATLFFGFDDLDLGLALERSGHDLWSSGVARDHGWTHMVEDRTASTAVQSPSWRRYYSLRNLIIVLRRNGRSRSALAMSLAAGIGKPLLNLPRRPRAAWRTLRLNTTAIRHGWTGRTGKHLDPLDLPDWLRGQ